MQQELRWLVLDLNSFFASCEQQEQPELRGQPLIVAPLLADSTCAIAASYAAKAYGIKTGMPIYEAKKLCPGLRIVEARPKLYRAYHDRIKTAVESCIPIADVLSIDEVACQLDRTQRTPEAAKALAHSIKCAIRTQVGSCLTSSIGFAGNQLLAKLASDMQKPDGLTLLPPADLPQAILHLPPRALPGIGPNMMARLERAGIHDMAALWAADAARLRRIWGGLQGVKFHALLHGADLPSVAAPLRRSIGHQHVLPPAERSLASATPVIRQLLTRAAERLRREGYYCRCLNLNIKWAHQQGYWEDRQSCGETQDTASLLRMLMTLWARTPAFAPQRIGVVLSDLVPETEHQGDLFTPACPAPRFRSAVPAPALAQAIDRINSLFGRGTLHYGVQRADLKNMTSKIAFRRVPDSREF